MILPNLPGPDLYLNLGVKLIFLTMKELTSRNKSYAKSNVLLLLILVIVKYKRTTYNLIEVVMLKTKINNLK